MESAEKTALLRRLARAEGQIGGLRRMLEEDKYCVDILNQLSAVRSALDQFGTDLVASHMKHCILGREKNEQHPQAAMMTEEELLDELKTALSRLL